MVVYEEYLKNQKDSEGGDKPKEEKAEEKA